MIYIESFIIQNLLINFCLLRLVQLTIKPKTNFLKMFFASLIYTITSTILIAFNLNAIVQNILKIICLFACLVVAFKQSAKQHFFSFALINIYNFSFIGATMLLSQKFNFLNFGLMGRSNISLETFTIFAIVLTYLFENVVNKIKFKIKNGNLVYPITLHFKQNKITINAFLDSGNLLCYNHQPVVVVDLESYLKLTNQDIVNFYLTKQLTENIKLSTVAGNNSLKIVEIDKIEIKLNNKIKVIDSKYIAINNLGGFKNSNYQALITPQMI